MADAIAKGLAVLAELYPDATVREARRAELGDAGLTALGNGVLRREDHSREMNELQAARTAAETREAEAKQVYDANKAWFDQQQANLVELDWLRQGIKPDPADPNKPAAPDPAKFITPEQLAETERGAVAFFSDLNTLSMQHFQQFGEILNTEALLRDKRVQQLGLRGVYAEVHKTQLDARATKLQQEAEAKIRQDERLIVQREQAASHTPYPVRGNEPSTLDAFERKPTDQAPATRTVDDMVGEYARLQAARGLPA